MSVKREAHKFADLETGEVFDAVGIITQEDLDRIEQNKKQKELRLMREEYMKTEKKENGTFVWLLYNVNTVLDFGISPAILTRLIYLSTYIEDDNKLWLAKTKSKSIREEDIRELLNLSDRTYGRFIDEVISNNILIKDDNDCFYINNAFFAKGQLSKVKAKNHLDKRYMKIYNKAIRKLYRNAKVTEHSRLAYLFQMIPFVNVNYNILCHNPMEEDKKNIKAMTMEEYCSLIGYSPDNARRLKTQLKKITINKTPILNFVDNLYGLFCFVNPRVFYGGRPENLKDVEIFGEFKK